jgi:hypothetical protein
VIRRVTGTLTVPLGAVRATVPSYWPSGMSTVLVTPTRMLAGVCAAAEATTQFGEGTIVKFNGTLPDCTVKLCSDGYASPTCCVIVMLDGVTCKGGGTLQRLNVTRI